MAPNIQHTIQFGKINLRKFWGNTSYNKKDCICCITLELKTIAPTIALFSAYATIRDSKSDTILLYGNCLDELSQIDELAKDPLFIQIYELWKKYHNHELHAGTPEQETALRNAVANEILPSLSMEYHNQHCMYLKSIGLYEIILPDNTIYHYGQGWSQQPIPNEDLTSMQTLMSA